MGTEWTQSTELYLIDLLIDHAHRGNKVDNTFNEQAWADMVEAFNEKFGFQCNKYLLEHWYICLMKQHDDVSNLLSHSGFMWDESQQMVTADDDVWESYVKVLSFSKNQKPGKKKREKRKKETLATVHLFFIVW